MATGAQAVSISAPASATQDTPRRVGVGLWGNALLRLRRDRLTIAAASILLLLILLAAAADLLADNVFHYGFTRQDLLNNYTRPTLSNPAFWLGSDDLGRSQIVRLLYG